MLSELQPAHEKGAVLTSERRFYDPDKMNNGWWSVGHLLFARPSTWARRATSPAAAAFLVVIVVIGLPNWALFSSNAPSSGGTGVASTSNSHPATQTRVSGVPDATQSYGAQPAKYALGQARHWTMVY